MYFRRYKQSKDQQQQLDLETAVYALKKNINHDNYLLEYTLITYNNSFSLQTHNCIVFSATPSRTTPSKRRRLIGRSPLLN